MCPFNTKIKYEETKTGHRVIIIKIIISLVFMEGYSVSLSVNLEQGFIKQ